MSKLFLISIFSLSSVYANDEKNENALDSFKNVIDTFSESKELREETLKDYGFEENNLKDQIDQQVDNFNINKFTDRVKRFARDNIPNVNIDVQANVDEPSIRDPFNLSGQSGIQRSGGGFGTSFLPSIGNSDIPALKLRGVITPSTDEPEDLLALLEVDKKDVYMVKVGDEISYDPRNPNAAIKIIKINRLTVTVQAGSLGNVLIIR